MASNIAAGHQCLHGRNDMRYLLVKGALANGACRKDAAPKVLVVGRSDNQGTTARNIDLSQKHAESAIKALTTEYKIDAKRLSAKGIASYAPVASNDNDAGREKNRRVELVKQ